PAAAPEPAAALAPAAPKPVAPKPVTAPKPAADAAAPAAAAAPVAPAKPAAPAAVDGAAPAPAAPKPAAPKPPAPKPPPAAILQTERTHCAIAVDFAAKGYHVDLAIPAADIVAVAQRLYAAEFSLDTMTGVDWQKLEQMEVVYDFVHFANGLRLVVRCRVPRANPELPSIAHIFQGANWHERETHDFFGIRFLGHPNLIPFLLPEDATYHPLRKDFIRAAD
ncbi:MAG TPA: NADH-quinone oxidoreductase subunit C, partial [Opitutaceae bacterium]|nr:NADH-quinone oxidoreductase subunit C [Opitutaceae bacterium]